MNNKIQQKICYQKKIEELFKIQKKINQRKNKKQINQLKKQKKQIQNNDYNKYFYKISNLIR